MATPLRPLWVAALLVSSALPAHGATPTDTLRDLFVRANVVIQAPQPQLTVDERVDLIREMAGAVFDVRRAAADALGGEWQARSPAEQAQFVELFADALQRGYLARVRSARVDDGVGVAFLSEAVKDDAAVVRTTLATRTGDALAIDYLMTRTGEKWAVVDAMIDGVSLVGNYRAQFSRVLQRYTYADLVEMMRAVAPASPRPVMALAAAAVMAGDRVRVMAVVSTEPGAETSGAPAGVATPTRDAPAAPETASATPVGNAPGADDRPAAAAATAMVSRAAAVETPGPPPAASPKRFWVEIGVFNDPEAAGRILARLTDPAIAIFTPPSADHPGSLTRVLVGPFTEGAAAAAKARELEAAGYRSRVAEE